MWYFLNRLGSFCSVITVFFSERLAHEAPMRMACKRLEGQLGGWCGTSHMRC